MAGPFDPNDEFARSAAVEITPAALSYTNQGARRNLEVVPELVTAIREAVTAVYGPDYRVEIMSGAQGEHDGKKSRGMTGSRRHTTGAAADVWVYSPSGERLTGDALIPLSQHWLGAKVGSVGFPAKASSSLHLDLVGGEGPGAVPRLKGEGAFWFYGTPSKDQRTALVQARDEGALPKYAVSLDAVRRGLIPPENIPDVASVTDTGVDPATPSSMLALQRSANDIGEGSSQDMLIRLLEERQGQPRPATMSPELARQRGADLVDVLRDRVASTVDRFGSLDTFYDIPPLGWSGPTANETPVMTAPAGTEDGRRVATEPVPADRWAGTRQEYYPNLPAAQDASALTPAARTVAPGSNLTAEQLAAIRATRVPGSALSPPGASLTAQQRYALSALPRTVAPIPADKSPQLRHMTEGGALYPKPRIGQALTDVIPITESEERFAAAGFDDPVDNIGMMPEFGDIRQAMASAPMPRRDPRTGAPVPAERLIRRTDPLDLERQERRRTADRYVPARRAITAPVPATQSSAMMQRRTTVAPVSASGSSVTPATMSPAIAAARAQPRPSSGAGQIVQATNGYFYERQADGTWRKATTGLYRRNDAGAMVPTRQSIPTPSGGGGNGGGGASWFDTVTSGGTYG